MRVRRSCDPTAFGVADSQSGRTRLAAAEGLGKLGPKSRTALPLLIRMYQANDIQYVGASHWSLGQVIKRIDAGAAERLGVE